MFRGILHLKPYKARYAYTRQNQTTRSVPAPKEQYPWPMSTTTNAIGGDSSDDGNVDIDVQVCLTCRLNNKTCDGRLPQCHSCEQSNVFCRRHSQETSTSEFCSDTASSDCLTCGSRAERCDRRRPRCAKCRGSNVFCGGYAPSLRNIPEAQFMPCVDENTKPEH